MHYTLIIHHVENYENWKKMFDKAANLRKEAGEVSYQVLSDHQLPNKIVHFSKWKSIQQAKIFFESPELKALRKQGGVKSPEFIYLNELAFGDL
jgi:quinol monooxygenase YgiN